MSDVKDTIVNGRAVLGIEFGSTRIKAVLVGEDNTPIASGAHDWENRLENGIWTYSLEDIWTGLQDCYRKMTEDVQAQYGVKVEKLGAIGFSAMMHGYLAFNRDGELLVPFRTWRNTITQEASEALTEAFKFHIPQRWSIAHLYQAILNGEDHVKDVDFFTTLDGYIHWQLTGEKVLGVGSASGMFPIDSDTKDYYTSMIAKFDELAAAKGMPWKVENLLPKVLLAGDQAGVLTAEGAKKLDPTGTLQPGCPLCPPEGDAGTGMAATNSVKQRTGNVSAGTSVFAMIVLEKALKKVHEEIDMVTTPSGDAVAMVHCNNCTSDLNAWVNIFREFAESFGIEADMNRIFGTLYNKALEGDKDCGGLLAYNYFSGEHITGFEEGRPMFVRTPDSRFNLANFMRANLYTSLGALKVGLDILLKEGVEPVGYVVVFRVPVVCQGDVGYTESTQMPFVDQKSASAYRTSPRQQDVSYRRGYICQSTVFSPCCGTVFLHVIYPLDATYAPIWELFLIPQNQFLTMSSVPDYLSLSNGRQAAGPAPGIP